MHSHKQVTLMGRRFCAWCVLNTLGFPLEHLLWEKAPGFVLLTHALGL